MIRYIIKRLIWLIPVIIAVSLIVFGLMELAPGNFIDAIQSEEMTPEMRQEMIEQYNLDKPMLYRYGIYMFNLVQGDLGVSDTTGLNVWTQFIERLPNTLILSFTALIIGAVIAIALGMVAARRPGSLLDNGVTVFALVGMSMPVFWLGLLLILAFSLTLGWLPSGTFENGIRSLILPAFCSSLSLMANAARQTRSNMLEVLKADYLRTARAKGVAEKTVIRKHALGNAWIPIITALGTSLGNQISGAVVIESVFAWPGIGRMAAEAVKQRDVTTTTGVVIMSTILYVLVQLIVDLLYAFVDPRIKSQYFRQGKKKKRAAAVAAVTPVPAIAALSTANVAAQDSPKSAPLPQTVPAAPIPAAVPVAAISEERVEVNAADEVSFVTRENIGIGDIADGDDREYKKRSQMVDIMRSLKRNKGAMAGLVILGLMVVCFFASLFISWESISTMSAKSRFAPISWQHLFGADNFGRDLFLRTIYGSRYTLAVGFGAVGFGAIFGVTAGCFAGYFGGRVDDIIMRCSDVLASLPGLLFGMVLVTVLGQNIRNLIMAVGIAAIPIYLRMTRASVLTIKNNEYVEAARATGLSHLRIIFTQVLPNGLAPIIVTLTASLGISIIVASSLSYLGFGVPVSYPEWGALIATSKEFARVAPNLLAFPGVFIMLTVLALNLLGDGVRDALDPKMKK